MTQPPTTISNLPRPGRFRIPRMQEFGLLMVITLLFIFLTFASKPINRHFDQTEIRDSAGNVTKVLPAATFTENGFLRTGNIIPFVFTEMSWMAVMAIGATIVIISGGIDISVGSIMGLAALGCAAAIQSFPENAPAWKILPIAIGVPLAIGLGCGLINGLLVVGLRMHPFIVTLATLSIFRWACERFVVTGSLPAGDQDLPRAFTKDFIAWEVKYPKFGGHATESFEPVPMILMLLCLALGWIYLQFTVWGRQTYAVGGNEEAARYSGISLGWTKMRVYLLSGLSAGIAGMITCGYYRSASTDTANGYELTVIAAAVVGGASLIGGRGTALGAFLGMLILQLISDGISVLGSISLYFVRIPVETKDTKLINGVAIIVAVAVDQLSAYLQQRQMAADRTLK